MDGSNIDGPWLELIPFRDLRSLAETTHIRKDNEEQ